MFLLVAFQQFRRKKRPTQEDHIPNDIHPQPIGEEAPARANNKPGVESKIWNHAHAKSREAGDRHVRGTEEKPSSHRLCTKTSHQERSCAVGEGVLRRQTECNHGRRVEQTPGPVVRVNDP